MPTPVLVPLCYTMIVGESSVSGKSLERATQGPVLGKSAVGLVSNWTQDETPLAPFTVSETPGKDSLWYIKGFRTPKRGCCSEKSIGGCVCLCVHMHACVCMLVTWHMTNFLIRLLTRAQIHMHLNGHYDTAYNGKNWKLTCSTRG